MVKIERRTTTPAYGHPPESSSGQASNGEELEQDLICKKLYDPFCSYYFYVPMWLKNGTLMNDAEEVTHAV